MKINRAYRYELKPNMTQRILLAKHSGCARFAYNWGLAQRITLYQEEKKSTNPMAQHKALNQLKQTEFPWMYEVSKCAPQEALRDLDRAFKNFFTGLKAGTKVGFPKFKKKGVHDSFRLTGTIKIKGKAVQLPRLGVIHLKEEPYVGGRILSATVNREADRWFVSLSCEVEIKEPKPVKGEVVGIDVGLNHFAIMSDGLKIEAPKPLAKYLKRLKRLSKKHSRKQKGSNNRKKSALALARLHRKIRNIRQDFIHKLTTKLARTKSEIVIEDLNVRGMMRNERLARHITDVGWGEFRRQLSYKTIWYGSALTTVNRFYPSSKTCSKCDYVMKEMPFSLREWDCPSCGTHHDRDENAAKNLKKQAKSIA